jgi:guanylate kinase
MQRMSESKEGKMVVLSAPSGAGKTTVAMHLLNLPEMNLSFSVSACSRPPRGSEVEGKDYYFLTTDEFKKKISNKEFIEWEEVYPGRYYGSLVSEVKRIWRSGKHVLFDIDVKGAMSIKRLYDEKALTLFIMPPSLEVLEERLRTRSTDSPEEIKRRIGKAREEMTYAGSFDHVIINNRLADALAEAEDLVKKFLDQQ